MLHAVVKWLVVEQQPHLQHSGPLCQSLVSCEHKKHSISSMSFRCNNCMSLACFCDEKFYERQSRFTLDIVNLLLSLINHCCYRNSQCICPIKWLFTNSTMVNIYVCVTPAGLTELNNWCIRFPFSDLHFISKK